MEKINFSDLNLNMEIQFKEIEYNDYKLQIVKYLPCIEKNNILIVTLEESYEDGIYNPFKLETFFHLNLILMYCQSIDYSDEDIADPLKLYDIYKDSGLLDIIIDAIEDEEYNELWNDLNALVEEKTKYNLSVMGIMNKIQLELPSMVEQLKNTENIDISKFSEVINFANAANGNRDIETNLSISHEE